MEAVTLTAAEPAKLSSVKLAALFVICFASSAVGGAISTLMSVYLPAVVKEMQGSKSQEEVNYLGGLINSLFIFGWAFGGFFWGLISDKTGRKTALILATASYGIFTILTGYMTSWGGIMACRFMSGFGVGGDLVIAFTLVSEVWPQKSKAVYTGILSIAFPVGIFSAGVINNFTNQWRQGFWVGAIPLVLSLMALWIISESDLWKKHRSEKRTAAAAPAATSASAPAAASSPPKRSSSSALVQAPTTRSVSGGCKGWPSHVPLRASLSPDPSGTTAFAACCSGSATESSSSSPSILSASDSRATGSTSMSCPTCRQVKPSRPLFQAGAGCAAALAETSLLTDRGSREMDFRSTVLRSRRGYS